MPAAARVQRQLADRDRHPAGPLVAEAQDALVVGDDDQADVVAGATKDVIDPADVIGRDPDAARTPEDVAELLARETDRRRVDDRQELLEVLDEEPVEQGLVAVLECGQADIPLEVIGLPPDVLQLQATCSSIFATPGGSRPCRPKASRSRNVNAVPLLRRGSANSSCPRLRTRRRFASATATASATSCLLVFMSTASKAGRHRHPGRGLH